MTTVISKINGLGESLAGVVFQWLSPLQDYLRPNRQSWQLSVNDFSKFPKESLGYALNCFYKREQVNPIAKIEQHDVCHVLFNYSTQVKDECFLQFFLLGNGQRSFLTIGTCVLSLMLFPFLTFQFRQHYLRGQEVKRVVHIDFKPLLSKNLTELQHHLKKQISL